MNLQDRAAGLRVFGDGPSSELWPNKIGDAPLFTLEERVEMVARAVHHLPNVEADSFDGLLVEYVERRAAQAVVRGLRAVSDSISSFTLTRTVSSAG